MSEKYIQIEQSAKEGKPLNKKLLITVSIVLIASIALASFLIWNFYTYEETVLSLTYETEPIVSSPLSGANYSWEAKAYSVRVFGNSPFDGKGYTRRERIMSDNRFRYSEFHNLNASLRLRFQIANATGYVLCNETMDTTDGCDREVIFEFKPGPVRVGNTFQVRIVLSLNVRYEYGAESVNQQFTLEREWTRTIQIRQSEPATGEQF